MSVSCQKKDVSHGRKNDIASQRPTAVLRTRITQQYIPLWYILHFADQRNKVGSALLVVGLSLLALLSGFGWARPARKHERTHLMPPADIVDLVSIHHPRVRGSPVLLHFLLVGVGDRVDWIGLDCWIIHIRHFHMISAGQREADHYLLCYYLHALSTFHLIC